MNTLEKRISFRAEKPESIAETYDDILDKIMEYVKQNNIEALSNLSQELLRRLIVAESRIQHHPLSNRSR